MLSPAPAQQHLTPAYHPQRRYSLTIRCSRIKSVIDGDSDSEAGGHAPQRVLWVARLATSYPTEVGEEW
eukprot:4064160-Pleurochrysis_carterae.AAC.1